MSYQRLAYIESLLNTSTIGWDERKEIENALIVAEDIEIEYIAHYIKNNQQDLVREGKASQKEITLRIKQMCNL